MRLLRKSKGYSLQALATRADVSAATIHKIEHSGMVPTISTLLKIANALEKPISYFVEDDEEAVPTVKTPADERPSIFTSHVGIELAGVSGSYGGFLMAGAVATVIPGANSGTRPMEHGGEEMLFVLS
jgi:DNA-binding XRE family transcriptional regulator